MVMFKPSSLQKKEVRVSKIILPNTFVPVRKLPLRYPLFFVAGPVRGGGDWQRPMCVALDTVTESKFVAAVPCRDWGDKHPLAEWFVSGNEHRFSRQLHWEQHYLNAAGYDMPLGCVIVYIAKESKRKPHPGPDPFSMDTRRELGKWMMKKKYEGTRVVFGADPEACGISVIQEELNVELGRHIPFYMDIHELAEAAAVEAKRKID